ncbi:aldo/keto reductase [Frondihabitans australicus]|uniref:Diketogulonate reductase-like aldo/keto reductase n=1 Tax=Frondihabitans australicus TaxID=386892 RepID=A0A495IH03_9MICO|nr:aldo/keto reductase [Frondihabitans australicus]RKR74356.1 diketogulonate reductase-like aldo/keto reductase [Frondihabitans australicus]
MSAPAHLVTLPNGTTSQRLGLGTWLLGEDPARHDTELAALRRGLDLGLTLVDTAEMYGDGAAETLIGEAIAGRRDEVVLVSKVLPSNASRRGVVDACRRSLERLGTDRIDVYLLHWRGRFPLAETVAGFEELAEAGDIGGWGVSNFDVDDLAELARVAGGSHAQLNQVLYNLARRGPEFDLLPRLREAGMPLMAYSPVDHGELLDDTTLDEIAEAKGVTPAQLALAWVLQAIPDGLVAVKASSVAHVEQNAAALEVSFTPQELAALDAAFPPPARHTPLEML